MHGSNSGQNDETRQSQAERLVEAVHRRATFFQDSTERTYARVRKGKGTMLLRTSSKGFRRIVLQSWAADFGGVPQPQAVTSAIEMIDARAAEAGTPETVSTRVGGRDGKIYLDLCDEARQVAEVSPTAWRITPSAQCDFLQKRTASALPVPTRGGSLDRLAHFLNVDDDGLVLIQAWLVGALHPTGPYPILVLEGEAGSAKSTATKMLKSLIDPTVPQVRSLPRSERDLGVAAEGSWVLAFDNLSGLRPWIADALCRLSTGGGIATRALFTDDEEQVFDLIRPVILNGIESVVTRQDLITRELVVQLHPIAEGDRRDERALWEAFEAERPALLGALLDAVMSALERAASIDLPRKPRMSDFATWVTAAEPALGWDPGTFLKVYEANAEAALRMSLDGSSLAKAIMTHVRTPARAGAWQGTATDLLDALNYAKDSQERRAQGWPRNAQSLSTQLRRLAPALRAGGVDIEFGWAGRDTAKQRWIEIRDEGWIAGSLNGDAGDGGDA